MPDRNEHAVQGFVLGPVRLDIPDPHAGDARGITQDFIEHAVPADIDLAGCNLRHQFVDQDGLGLEAVATMYHGHLAGNVRQVKRFFDRGVAAADHRDFLILVEEAVAGGAARDALAHEGGLRLEPQVLSRRTGRDDQGVAGVGARIADQPERTRTELDRVDLVENELGIEALGMLVKALHQLRALDAFGVGRPVVDISCGHQLAALCQTCHKNRLQIGAGGVNRRGIAGRS